jgi:AraC-like DNA-binding protein
MADPTQQNSINQGDPLSDVLETIRLRGAVFFLWEPTFPYAQGVANGKKLAPFVAPGADQVISYHIVTEGPCWGAVTGEEPVRLVTGDILLLPQGDAYTISNEPQLPRPEDEGPSVEFFRSMAAGEMPAVIRGGGDCQEQNKLICGFLGCDMRPYNPLLGTLPRLIRLPAPEVANDPLSSLIEYAISESAQDRGGERCLLLRLSELMFVEVLRRYLRTMPASAAGWLDGLRDPVVGKALNLLHQQIARPWTLEMLASQVGISRSALAERFTQIVGEPPMQYLTRWRMQAAAGRLAAGGNKVYAVAREVGYDSEAAFSRAFKRATGVTPKQWREQRSKIGQD